MLDVDPATEAALVDARVCVLIKIDYAAAVQRFVVGAMGLRWGGHDWSAITHQATIGSVHATQSSEATAVRLTFERVSQSTVASILADPVRGRDAALYVAVVDDSHRLIGSPVEFYSGVCDAPKLLVNRGLMRVEQDISGEWMLWNRASDSRFTDAEQQRLHPGDLGFQYVGMSWSYAWPNKEYWIQ